MKYPTPVINAGSQSQNVTFGIYFVSSIKKYVYFLLWIIIFTGWYHNSTTFAIFKNHEDYLKERNPCSVITDVEEFNKDSFVEINMIIKSELLIN